MDRVDEFIRVGGDDRERANPFLGLGSLPVLPHAREGEWPTAFHANGGGLLWATFDRLPFEKVVDRSKASAMAVRISETWKLGHCFGFGVDRFPPAILVLAPMRD